MIVYSVALSDSTRIVATLAEAIALARVELSYDDSNHGFEEIEIEKCHVLPVTKQLLIDALNGWGGWCEKSEVVKTVRKRPVK